MDDSIETDLERGWHAVVTYNSTVGLASILHGVPVFCDPSCFYAEMCSTSLSRIDDPRWPLLGDRVEFFSRLAYAQWTFDELASGEALDFIMPHAQQVAA